MYRILIDRIGRQGVLVLDESDFPPGERAKGLLRNPRLPFEAVTVEGARGARLHVRCYGPADAKPVVLVHGFACRLEYWNPQINALAATNRVIVYDQRGFGRSTFGTVRLSPDVLGDDLSAILEATVRAEEKAVVVGHSFGGITVMAWAAKYSEWVQRYASSVLLADTVGERFSAATEVLPFAGRYALLRRPLLGAVLRTRVRLPDSPPFKRLLRDAALNPNASRAEVDFLFAMVSGAAIDVRTQWSAGLLKLTAGAGLANLKVPTTVLVGDRDRLTPPAVARRMADTLRANGWLHRLVELPGVGHCTNIEAPEQFDEQIRDLLSLTPTTSGAFD